MRQEQTRQLGRALMALSVVQLLVFLIGATRRSYVVVAVPVGVAITLIAGLGFWVGYTMAHTDWDDPADYPPAPAAPPYPTSQVPETDVVAAAEGAPPPESFTR